MPSFIIKIVLVVVSFAACVSAQLDEGQLRKKLGGHTLNIDVGGKQVQATIKAVSVTFSTPYQNFEATIGFEVDQADYDFIVIVYWGQGMYLSGGFHPGAKPYRGTKVINKSGASVEVAHMANA